MMNETNSTASVDSDTNTLSSQQQQQEIFIQAPASPTLSGISASFPNYSLFEGDRSDYLNFGVPLYKASLKCDWNAAKRILDEKPKLVRYSLTENGETALHLSASVKRSKHAEKFVENLMERMTPEDLTLVNRSSNTALFLAAANGNIKTVNIMLKKNRDLHLIAGTYGLDMPLNAAAEFGNHEVARYLYERSNGLSDDGWNNIHRGYLLERCVEADMFDVALEIVKRYPKLGNGGAGLMILAKKPDVFTETKLDMIASKINSVFTLIGLKTRGKENEALQLLNIIWKNISILNKEEIDGILRGPPDLITNEEEPYLENVIQALQLKKLINKLKEETEKIMQQTIRNLDQTPQLLELISEHLVNMHGMLKQEYNGYQVLKLKKYTIFVLSKLHDETQEIVEKPQTQKAALLLKRVIYEYIEQMHEETEKIISHITGVHSRETHSSQIHFVAAEMGNTKFLIELIRQYPDIIMKVNDSNQSIFHIAVKQRHESIYNLLYEIGAMKDLITPLTDEHDNNMLHLVGKIAPKVRLADVSGPALQMQRELLWFKEVRNMVPPAYRERKNKYGQTGYEIFTEEHKELVTQGEKWMKGMASQCMVVATLVATIVFAAAFTVPGGYNQNDGIPIFYRKVTFVIFVLADAISLFLSSASILTFLSLLTSRYAEHDFMESLPRKLMLGLVTLFLSITAMMVTFSVSFFILYHKEMKWVPIFIGVFAVPPVILYVLLQHNLLIDVLRSSYGSRYLFKPRKQVLF